MDTTDYYSLLGLKPGATEAEIKQAYRKMVFRYHPDRNPGDAEASEKLKEVLEAYATLSDSAKRASYDAANGCSAEENGKQERAKEQFGSNASEGFTFSYNFKAKVEPQPRCPGCAAEGTNHIVSRRGGASDSGGKQFIFSPFQIVFCSQCGHVYGVTGQL